jgi:hypothetical protein
MEDLIGAVPGHSFELFHGYGHYHDTDVRTSGGWKISSSRLSGLRIAVR